MINKQSGLINYIILIVIVLIILGYYGIDIKKIIEKQEVRENISYTTDKIISYWDKYLKNPVSYIGKDIILEKIIVPGIKLIK